MSAQAGAATIGALVVPLPAGVVLLDGARAPSDLRAWLGRLQGRRSDPFPAGQGICWRPSPASFTLVARGEIDGRPVPVGYATAGLCSDPDDMQLNVKFLFVDSRARLDGVGQRLGEALAGVVVAALAQARERDGHLAPIGIHVAADTQSEGGRRIVRAIDTMAQTGLAELRGEAAWQSAGIVAAERPCPEDAPDFAF